MSALVFILVLGTIQRNSYPFLICPISLGVLIFKPNIPSSFDHLSLSSFTFSEYVTICLFFSCNLYIDKNFFPGGSHFFDSWLNVDILFPGCLMRAEIPFWDCFVLCCTRTLMAPSPKQRWCRALWPKKGGNSSRPSGKPRWILFPWDSTNTGLILCLMVGPWEAGVDFSKKILSLWVHREGALPAHTFSLGWNPQPLAMALVIWFFPSVKACFCLFCFWNKCL